MLASKVWRIAQTYGKRYLTPQFLLSGKTTNKIQFIKEVFQLKDTRHHSKLQGNAGDRIIKQGGLKEALKKARERNSAPGKTLRRLFTRLLGKGLLQMYSLQSIKDRLWYASNQSSTNIFKWKDGSNLQQTVSKILDKALTRNKATDSAYLSSSAVYYGRGSPNYGDKQYGVGQLELTYLRSHGCPPTKRRPGKTYVYPSVSLITWAMMKNALGSCGTGAFTVFRRMHLQGSRGGIPSETFRDSGLLN